MRIEIINNKIYIRNQTRTRERERERERENAVKQQ